MLFMLFVCFMSVNAYICLLYVLVPRMYLVPVEVRKGHQRVWNWSYTQYEPLYGWWDLNLGPL